MTRATWYRKGKPEPARPMSPELAELTAGLKEAFARNPYMGFRSKRTYERHQRVLRADWTLGVAVLNGEMKAAEAEKIISDPIKYNWWLQWYGRQLDLTEYVAWVIERQLHALEHPPKPLPAMRKIVALREGPGGEIFKDVQTIYYLPGPA